MRTIETKVYTIDELREQFPDGYRRACENWAQDCRESPDIPWGDEVFDSLRACFKAAGLSMRDWSLGPWNRGGFITVDGDDETLDLSGAEALAWANTWIPEGTLDAAGKVVGQCGWTGVCYDDDLIEAVLESLRGGESVKDAFRGLADVVQRLMESDCEQNESEETFLANCDGREFTEYGEEV